ncbi:MAG: hypothetical protein PSV35_08795, partial [bacterium]|nr:hypothetical protein [bacterium]
MKTKMQFKITSDMQHNRNCYAYLTQLKSFVTADILYIAPGLIPLFNLDKKYTPTTPYGNLYSSTITYLEEQIEKLYSNINETQVKSLDDLIFAVYHNNNQILEHEAWIKQLNAPFASYYKNKSTLLSDFSRDDYKTINLITPEKSQSVLARLASVFTPNFKPQ